jgi:regulator of RNase E activity RraA
VADEEGIVVVPHDRQSDALHKAQSKQDKEAAQSLDEWEADHRARVDKALRDNGFAD